MVTGTGNGSRTGVDPRTRTAGTGGRRLGSPVQRGPEEVPVPRRWGFMALGLALVLACGLGFLALYEGAGDRKPVVVAAGDVGKWETIERGDLRVALVAAEPGVATVPESDLDEVVGRVAATELTEGSVLSPRDIADDGDRLVAEDEALVGARLGAGAVPLGDLPAGAPILVIVRPGPSEPDAEAREVPGWLAELGGRDPNTGAREASLVVPQQVAGFVAAAAADERIAVVGLEG